MLTFQCYVFLISAVVFPMAFAQERDFSKVEIKVTKVSGQVYMLEGAGGNIAALVGEEGIVIVDDQYAPLAEKIAAALKATNITDKPVRYVINTHLHGDHTGGNLFFGRAATIIAHENVRKRLAIDGTLGNGGSMRMERKAVDKGALPIITFEQGVSVHLNGEDIRAIHLPSGHTDGDSIVHFEKANVVHMGDNFVTSGFPFIDIGSGGSIDGMTNGLEKAIANLSADVKVIPGHGSVSSLTDVRTFIKMLKDTKSVIEKAIAQGKTLEQIQKAKVLNAWDQYSGGFIKTDTYIESLYNSLMKKKGSGTVKHN